MNDVLLTNEQFHEIKRVMKEAVASLATNPICNFPKDSFYVNPVSYTISKTLKTEFDKPLN